MIVKNISGESRYFGFTRHEPVRGRVIANNATTTLPDNSEEVLAQVQAYVAAGVMEITEGPADAGLVASANLPAQGYILASGAVADADEVTVAGLAFKFGNTPTDAALGEFSVSLGAYWAGDGAAATVAMGTLRTALNLNTATTGIIADPPFALSTSEFLPLRAAGGVIDTAGLTLVKNTGANLAVSGATLTAGTAGAAKGMAIVAHTVTSDEITAGVVIISTALASITAFLVQVRRAGVAVAWDGKATASGGTLALDNSASADTVAGDIVTVFAQE